MPAQRPERPCIWCSRTTTSPRRICMSCKTRVAYQESPGSSHALTGGSWRPGPGGVLRWQPDEQRSA